MKCLARHTGEVEVWLYSFFNLGARLRWVVNGVSQLLCLRQRPVPVVQKAG